MQNHYNDRNPSVCRHEFRDTRHCFYCGVHVDVLLQQKRDELERFEAEQSGTIDEAYAAASQKTHRQFAALTRPELTLEQRIGDLEAAIVTLQHHVKSIRARLAPTAERGSEDTPPRPAEDPRQP